MKMKIILLMALILSLTGCSSTKDLETSFSSLERFRERQVSKLVKYIENDQSLSGREKNTFNTELKEFDENLKKIREILKKK